MNLENPSQERKRVRKNAERLFAFETEYMAPLGFFQNANNSRLRHTAISRIRYLAKTPGFEYDPYVQLHAVTYFDRCISSDRVQAREYLARYIFSCTVLAWKRRSNDFSVRLLLERNGLGVHEQLVQAIESMERRILDALNPKTDSITALSFINFFFSLIQVDDPDQIQTVNTKKISEHVLFMHYGTPSIIAAVGVVAERTENGDFCEPILRCKFVDTDAFENCFDLLKSKRVVLVPRIDEPESPLPLPPPPPPTQQEEQDQVNVEEGEDNLVANAAVIPRVDFPVSPLQVSKKRTRG
ncbi:hypothetical protein Vadar_001436 [Vaccinium darrowii]|uniref:Uncharacterized protein n=1 Tax=Vaccinium darrowii TaxID=229202 RepID=A0ACB7XMF3_9ERIC|nr:hypothetical protein Vadar_001436 [Vaccinium darrowii]